MKTIHLIGDEIFFKLTTNTEDYFNFFKARKNISMFSSLLGFPTADIEAVQEHRHHF